MNREDIIRMAREAGWDAHHAEFDTRIERFAALVMSAESDRLTDFAIQAAEKSVDMAIALEREACAEVCKKHADFYAGLEPSPIAQSAWAACVDNRDTIRARGQA